MKTWRLYIPVSQGIDGDGVGDGYGWEESDGYGDSHTGFDGNGRLNAYFDGSGENGVSGNGWGVGGALVLHEVMT